VALTFFLVHDTFHRMNTLTWETVCNDRSLRDLPFKIETNRNGQIVMSPAKKEHAGYQGEIAKQLGILMRNGRVLVECAIETDDATKVADVAWASQARWKALDDSASCSIAPEICVTVESWCNTAAEMAEKRGLYLAAGAVEFWFCDLQGSLVFFDADGPIAASRLCSGFPPAIAL